jgi:peptidoglycan/LPS O-acetylase OafA/YrhL
MGGMFGFGYGGVDIFFVISGFLVYYVHCWELGRKQFGVDFLIKKCLRIFPVYWLVLIILLAVYLLIPSYGLAETRNPVYVMQSFLLLPLRNMTYSALSVAWTLRYELLFYLLFCAMFFLKRKTAFSFLLLWVLISAVNLILGVIGLGTENFDFNFLFSAYNLEFALGSISAYLVINTYVSKKLSLIVFLSGVFIFMTTSMLDVICHLQLHRFLYYGIPAVIIIYGMTAYEFNHGMRCTKPLVYLGNASYSVFLVHLPTISFLNKIFMKFSIYELTGYFAGIAVIGVLSVISGCIFYELVEKNMNRLLANIRVKDIMQRGSITQ